MPRAITDISKIKYPCYVQPKLNGQRTVYLPQVGLVDKSGSEFEFSILNDVLESVSTVLDGVIYNNKYYIFDCVPELAWNLQQYKRVYEDRLKDIRRIVNDQICDYSKVIDIPTDIVEQPSELIKIYKQSLNLGYKGVIIRDGDSLYQWKKVKDFSILKLEPKEKNE